jgi:hypothetical protein
MRRYLWFGVVVAVFLVAGSALAQQQNQGAQSSASQAQSPTGQASSQTSQTPPAQEDPLVAAARRAREQKKDQTKPAKVITNDNIPTQGGISAVGAAPSATPGNEADNPAGAPTKSGASSPNDEKSWREKFANLRHKVDQDQAELDVMQRELGVLDVQYYNDPVKAMQQDLTRADINKKTADIEAKKQQLEADKQAISDAEDDLRKAGGDAGWAR